MKLKKLHSPIFVILLLFFFGLQSCKKVSQSIPIKQSNLAEIDRNIALGDQFFAKNNYDSSYYYFNKAKSACDIKRDSSRFIYSLSNLATIQQIQGDFSGSEATAMEAFPVLENTQNPKYKWNIYTILGINYLNTFDYENALYYFNKALNLKIDSSRKSGTKNNIALVYMEKSNYQKAIEILFPLTLKKETINETAEFSRILDNLGFCYYKVGNPKAIDYLNQSLKTRIKIKDDWGLISSYIHLSMFNKKNNPNLANDYAQLAFEKTTNLNCVDDRLQSLELLIQNSSDNQVKKYSLNYIRINDSINKVRQIAKNQFAKIKYDSKKEKNENLILKAQKNENALQLEIQKNRILFLSLFTIIGLAFTVVLFRFKKERNKREKIKTSYNTEIRIAKKLHDELANDVYQTMAFAETKDLSSNENKEILLTNLDTIYSRTRNISKQNSTIEMGLNYLPNLKEMISEFSTESVNIIINGLDSINWIAIDSTKKITLYRVLQELLVNMKKHSKCSLVVLSFKKNENKLHLNYSDNGIGASLKELKTRNGLQNVENRIQAINGTITFDTQSNKGFKSNIIFPI